MASLLRYQPSPRVHPFTACVGGKLYMWGGRTQDWTESGKKKLQSVIEIFDPYVEEWRQQPTTGTPPPLGLCSGGCGAIGGHLYICCGTDGSSRHNTLHELSTTTWRWRGLGVQNITEGPMRKAGCGMVVYDGKLVLFGGFGIPHSQIQPGASFVKYSKKNSTDGSGWSNEVHLIDPSVGMWFLTSHYCEVGIIEHSTTALCSDRGSYNAFGLTYVSMCVIQHGAEKSH